MLGCGTILAPLESPVRDILNGTKLIENRFVQTKLQGFKIGHPNFGKNLMVETDDKINHF